MIDVSIALEYLKFIFIFKVVYSLLFTVEILAY